MNFRQAYLLLFCLILSLSRTISAQEMVLVVERCKALDQNSPIHNIWVDDENVKWVANSKGLFKVLALDLVQQVPIPAGTTSLLNIRGGNANLEWSTSGMQQIMGSGTITCGAYNPKDKTVWIGTLENGAYQLSLEPLKLVQTISTSNSKLTSNQINDIFIQPNGTIWIATNDGMLTGEGNKWNLQERYLNFVGVDSWNNNLWILGDNFLWQVDNKGKWNAIAIEPRNVEGQLRDIAVDGKGRVWIASNMMTGFNVEMNRYQRFGPGQYFTSQYVNCLDVDHDGSIWTGTDDKGLYLIQWEDAMTVNILMDTPYDCKSKTPSAGLTAKVTGGEPPLLYNWSSGQTTEKLTKLGPGVYTLTVTDAKGIKKEGKYEIPDPNLKVTIQLVRAASGKPEGDGSATLIVENGNAPITYAWDNGETIQTAIKLNTGLHAVTITDASGCSAVQQIDVNEKVQTLTVFARFISANSCADSHNGSAELDVNGGKEPYTYAWNPNIGNTAKVSELPVGLYSVTVTDKNGATAATSVNINAPALLQASVQQTGPASVNEANGQAEAKVAGGSSPYNYKWDSGQVNASVKNLSGGLHTITITDSNGCSTTASVTITENITALGIIIKQPVKISCHGDAAASLMVEINGGKSPYQYSWNTGQKSATLDNLKAGNYAVTVTDAAGSTFASNYIVSEPDPLNVSASVDAVAATNQLNGKASVKASGGSGNFQYAWDSGEKNAKAVALGPGAHTMTVTDGAGCTAVATIDMKENITALQVKIEETRMVKCAGSAEGIATALPSGGKEPYTFLWSNQGTTASIENLPDGLYKLTVTDGSGQTATSVITLNSPQALKIDVKAESAPSINKSDGKASVTVSGGTGKYVYQWSNGETTPKAITLGAGHHTVSVTDENKCQVTGEVVMTENILPMSVSIRESKPIACADGRDGVLAPEVTGGKPPYSYQWQGGTNTWNTESLTGAGAGKYSLQVTDVAGTVSSATIEISAPKPLELTVDDITPASTNNKDGKVQLHASGGTAQYSLEGTSLPAGKNTFTIDRLAAGDHLLVVRDGAGCSQEIRVTIPENVLPLSASIQQTNENKCAGGQSASLEVTAKGGKSPYTYTWKTGGKENNIRNLGDGTYSVTVLDAAGQSSAAEFSVRSPAPLEVKLSNIRSATNDRINDGKANAETTGGTGTCSFQWSSGETQHQAMKLPLGPGHVIVTDQNGCTAKSDFVIKEKVLPELTPSRIASGEPMRLEKIQFKADSTNIEDEAIPSLDELYEFLYDNPTVIIEVSGHTNGLPADEYCDRISTERAQSVANYIIGKGIESRRVIAKGYGKRKPVATNLTPEGRKKNQRVEIRLIKIEE